jgi:hypothetical protein
MAMDGGSKYNEPVAPEPVAFCKYTTGAIKGEILTEISSFH